MKLWIINLARIFCFLSLIALIFYQIDTYQAERAVRLYFSQNPVKRYFFCSRSADEIRIEGLIQTKDEVQVFSAKFKRNFMDWKFDQLNLNIKSSICLVTKDRLPVKAKILDQIILKYKLALVKTDQGNFKMNVDSADE